MSFRPAGDLYDALHRFESRYRRRDVYPVHKKLDFDGPGPSDIYDWVIDKASLPDNGDILDAGCGVGFGTRRMAENCSSKVVGISVSAAEIRTATRMAARSHAADRLFFRYTDYKSLEVGSYDLIVAVESLKHADELASTLEKLRSAVRPGGRIVIVEDCFEGDPENPDAVHLAKYWGLSELYGEADYMALAESGSTQLFDFTRLISKPKWGSQLRQVLVRGATCLPDKFSSTPVFAAFAGGVHLERLYAAGQMRYKAIVVSL